MSKDNTKKQKESKNVAKAKSIVKAKKQGKSVKTHKTHLKVRFYRPKTLQLARKPVYARSIKQLSSNTNNFDKYKVIEHPSTTEKSMKKLEEENTLTFIVNIESTKPKIKKALVQLYNLKIRSINTLIRQFNLKDLMERKRHMLDQLLLKMQ